MNRKQLSYLTFKRFFDFFTALSALVLLSPLFLVLAILIRVGLGSPILFRQNRPGRNERVFEIYKFRTMTDQCDEEGNLLSDDQRLTAFGRFLRSSSLDELPELINILIGDMSVVGPRPLLVEYLPLYSPDQRRRHAVRPGLTGLAQVNGRNSLSWEAKFEYDVYYVDNISFVLDLKIMMKTVYKVIRREGISQNGHETMPPFRGSES
jgi:undecaprenyl phosphate N,N'-diacetylbacillosamine 1-phosphate transferase